MGIKKPEEGKRPWSDRSLPRYHEGIAFLVTQPGYVPSKSFHGGKEQLIFPLR